MTKITGNVLKLLTILEGHLANSAVTTDKINNSAVTNVKVLDRTLQSTKLALASITNAEITPGTLTEGLYGTASIPTAAYKDLSVTTAKMALGSVGSTILGAGAVLNQHIGDGEVRQNHYGAGSIQTSHYADQSVATAKLADGGVTPVKIQALTANRVVVTDDNGLITPLSAGAEGQALMVTGGDLGWGAVAIPTGVIVPYFGTAIPSGWVFANGSTIGSSASSADQISDTYRTLFEFLWNSFSDTIIPVVGGRGASAAADWTANKAISTPDLRGRAPIGVEKTETSSNRVDPAILTTGSASQVGSVGGADKIGLSISDIPSHTHLLFVDNYSQPPASRTDAKKTSANSVYVHGDEGPADDVVFYRMAFTTTYITPSVGKSSPAGTGSSPEHRNMPPFMLVNYIIKA